jgi:hypothetical protein
MTRKIFTYICSLSFLFLAFAPIADAYERDYRQDFLVDNFTKDIQKYMELVREIENDIPAPINKSTLRLLEEQFLHIFDLIDFEIIRLQDVSFNQLQKLEIESIFLEIFQQFEASLDQLEKKTAKDDEANFEKMKDKLFLYSISYRENLYTLISKIKAKKTITKGNFLAKISEKNEDIDVVISRLNRMNENFKNLIEEVKEGQGTINSLNKLHLDAFDYVEIAEDEIRKINYIPIDEISRLKKATNDLIDEIDSFDNELSEQENNFITNYPERVNNLQQILNSAGKQIDLACTEVVESRNKELSLYDILDEIDKSIIKTIKNTRSIPSNDRLAIAIALHDLYDHYDDDKKQDAKEISEELIEHFSINSVYENDSIKDLKFIAESTVDSFTIIRDDSFSTSVVDVTSKLELYIDKILSKKNQLKSSYDSIDELEEIEEELTTLLLTARNAIYELTLLELDANDINAINSKIDELQNATKTTLEELIDRSSTSLKTYYDEISFDLVGSEEGSGQPATSAYSLITNLYETVQIIKNTETSSTPSQVLGFIENKVNSLNNFKSGWGSTKTSIAVFREAEQNLKDMFSDISYQINRLIDYPFVGTVNSYTIISNTAHYYRNLINEIEDQLTLVKDQISESEYELTEEKILEFYQEIDYGMSLLEDSIGSSLNPSLLDTLNELIAEEKKRLDRAYDSLKAYSSSSNQSIKYLKDDLNSIKSDILDMYSDLPEIIDKTRDFEKISNELLDIMTNLERTTKELSAKSLKIDEKKEVQLIYDEIIQPALKSVNKIIKTKDSKLNSRFRTFKDTFFENLLLSRIAMDEIELNDTAETYRTQTNLNRIDKAVKETNLTVSSFFDINDYHENLDDFRYRFKKVDDELKLLLENKPELEEHQIDNLKRNRNTFSNYFKNTIKNFRDAFFPDEDREYIEDSFVMYSSRYDKIFNSLFEGSLNGYNAPTYSFDEIYEPIGETTESSTEELDNETFLEGVDTDFFDVKADNIFSPYVMRLVEENAISGYEDGLFHPNKPISRAEFIKVAVSAKGYQENQLRTNNIDFLDIDIANPLAPFIGFALNNNYIKGYSNDYFGPNDQISRIDAIRILIRMLNLASIKFPTESEYFSDILSSDLATLTDRTFEAGIISGYSDGTFKPFNSISRGEAAKILANAFLF